MCSTIPCSFYWSYALEGGDGVICILHVLTHPTRLQRSSAKIIQLNTKGENHKTLDMNT